ncbi:MAG TPA: DUF3108 domain-containing protein [Anaeromyxobacteraceae bacterium]|nr:DUF3108 domain-containing protein [Anaeromyxobacteraceae bacterium]
MSPLLLALALALGQPTSAGAACGLPALLPEGAPFHTGEVLSYELEIVLVKAGKLTLQVDRPLARSHLVPLKARAQNTAAFANVRRLAAVALSWIDAASLRPERYHEEADEDGVRRSLDVRFSPSTATLTLDERWRDKAGSRSFPRQGEALDVLSGLYRLRAARLVPGEPLCLDLVAAGRLWRTTARVAPGRERVDTPAGRFETLRVDIEANRADLAPGAKGRTRQLHVWLTADARRLPVSMVGEIDVGPVSATLVGSRTP